MLLASFTYLPYQTKKTNRTLYLMLFSLCTCGLWFDCNTSTGIYSWLAPGLAPPYKGGVFPKWHRIFILRRNGRNPMIYIIQVIPSYGISNHKGKVKNDNCFICSINNVTSRLLAGVCRAYYLDIMHVHPSKIILIVQRSRFNAINEHGKKKDLQTGSLLTNSNSYLMTFSQ